MSPSSNFERLLLLAMDSADCFGHDWIGTERLLIVLVAEADGIAA